MRPPYLSVQMPSGTRINEPVSTGVAVSRPNSVAFKPSVFLIGIPITPNIIQTMKQTVKASVLTSSTASAWLFLLMAMSASDSCGHCRNCRRTAPSFRRLAARRQKDDAEADPPRPEELRRLQTG